MRWAEHVAHMGMKNEHILDKEPQERRSLATARCRWKVNIKNGVTDVKIQTVLNWFRVGSNGGSL
jgi:hypothetical protein